MSSRPIPPRARTRGRGRAASVGLLAALAVAVPAGASGAADAVDATIVIEGTAVQFIGDGIPAAPGEGFSESSTTLMVEVDGVLLDVPESVVVADVHGGDVVEVTLQADAALNAPQAVAEAAAQGTRATIVAVEEVSAGPGTAPMAASSTGAHQLVVLPVHWGATDGTPVSTLQTMANGAASYWEKQSGGRMDVQQEVRSWAQITPPANCSDASLNHVYTQALGVHGVAAATETRHIAVYFPDTLGCPFAGLAQVGGGIIFVNGWPEVYVLAHEFGHNVGLGHANTLHCVQGATRTPMTGSCSVTEYGDDADVMGQGVDWDNPGNLSSGFADILGYASLAEFSTPPTSTMDVGIQALSSINNRRGVKVYIDGANLYADYRPAVSPDLHRPEWAGVQLHVVTGDEWGTATSYLLDMQPNNPEFLAPNLPVGAIWEIPGAGITLKTKSASGSSAVISVGPGAAVEQVKRYVTKVYLDLFNRGVDPTGLQGWTQALMSGTPRIAVTNAITYSDEYRRTLIVGSYNTYLGRGPDPSGADNWLIAMRQGATIQQMEAGFIASSEYYAKAGGTDAAWVKKLYQHVLGRAAAPAEVNAWTDALAQGGSRYQVAMGFLVSYEHLTDVVNAYYVSLLGRGIDPAGAHSWVIAIQGGTRVEAVIGGIIASDEYYSKV